MKNKILGILAPCDGTPESEEAFAAMMPMVRANDPEVTVLYVFKDPQASEVPPVSVIRACVALQEQGVRAHLSLREGNPAGEILKFAKTRDVDLIVMATQGRSGIQRLVAGSVAEEVLRQAEVPVLLTRPGGAKCGWSRIVVALDGSARSQEILQDVIPLARTLKASVDLLQVTFPPITMSGLGDVGGVVIREDPMPYLKQLQSWLLEEGIEARAVAPVGRAASAVLHHVLESGASLLCLTTHGRTGFGRVLMGSVAEEIVRHAVCPVLLRRTVRQDGIPLNSTKDQTILEPRRT